MASLLGSKFCITSLRADVTDLQEAVIDVFSRAGPVRVPSWKYPDKCGSDLDMTELLELYDYSEDEEERQIAHIVLLELVIDRLVLLLQAMSKFMDQTLGVKSANRPSQSKSSTSIGLVVKKYWNKVVQASGALIQSSSDLKKLKRRVGDLEKALSQESEQKQELQAVTETLNQTLRTAKTPFPLSDIDQVLSRATSAISISRDECIKATQTIETAFVPCESCDCVQQNFRHVGTQIIHMCQQHGLPSNLVKCKKDLEGIDWLTASDVTRWATEQNTDLKRLQKYLTDFQQCQEDLRTQKQKVKDSGKKISECDKEIKLERETQATQRKHYERKITNIETDKEEAIATAKRQTDAVKSHKQQLEQQLDQLKQQFSTQETMLSELETAKNKVEQELEESRTNNAEVKRLEKDVSLVEKKLQEATSQLKTTEQDLTRERAKAKSTEKHTQSVQGKQGQLLSRLDDLDRENDALRSEVSELEEVKDKLTDELEATKDERRRDREKQRETEALVTQLRRDKASVEDSLVDLQANIHSLQATIQQAHEKERLLVEYPDLNGPVNPDLQGTGDLAKDMENQVKANTARIQLLEQQNIKLRNTITKVLQTRQKPQAVPTVPVPLWRTKTPIDESEQEYRPESSNHVPSRTKPKPEKPKTKPESTPLDDLDSRFSVLIGKGAIGRGGDKNKSSRSRPSSAIKSNSQTNQAALKKSILNQKGGRSGSGRSDYKQEDVFTCVRCDKIYSSSRDLDIHQSYCRAK